MISAESTDIFGAPIYTYTRFQAVKDGVQVPVLEATSREAGIMIPVYLTRTVFDLYVAVPPKVEGQDMEGRLWDVLYMTGRAMRRSKPDVDRVTVQLYVRNDNRRPRLVQVVAAIGARDINDPQPVLTIHLPAGG